MSVRNLGERLNRLEAARPAAEEHPLAAVTAPRRAAALRQWPRGEPAAVLFEQILDDIGPVIPGEDPRERFRRVSGHPDFPRCSSLAIRSLAEVLKRPQAQRALAGQLAQLTSGKGADR